MSPVNARDVLLFKISNYLTSTLAFFLPALSSLLLFSMFTAHQAVYGQQGQCRSSTVFEKD